MFSQPEIAAFLEVPLSTVKYRLKVARARLKQERLDMLKAGQDGQVTLEASGAGASCGGAAPEFGPTSSRPSIAEAASPHCIGCTDVPLQVADRAVAQHQRGVTETQVFATSLHPAVLPQVQPHRIPVHAVVARALRAAVQRTTILRI